VVQGCTSLPTTRKIHCVLYLPYIDDFCSPGTFSALDQDLKPISKIDLAIGPPGPTKRQQEGISNGHGVVTHPMLGNRVLIPDLSQDKVWVIECSLSSCKNVSSLTVPPGTGPRHATIWINESGERSDKPMFLYVVGEVSNMIEGYKVNVSESGLTFDHVFSTSATQTPIKETYAAGEILTSVSSFSIDMRFNGTVD
jgi:6-phosphogluconolactonase (cycloisomerase 2 family)